MRMARTLPRWPLRTSLQAVPADAGEPDADALARRLAGERPAGGVPAQRVGEQRERCRGPGQELPAGPGAACGGHEGLSRDGGKGEKRTNHRGTEDTEG